MTRHLLLVPIPKDGDPDPLGLLAEGPCGARVPMAAHVWEDGDGSRHIWVDATDPRYDWPPGTPLSLPLIFNGEHTGELGLARVAMLLAGDICGIAQKLMGRSAHGLALLGEDRGLWDVVIVDG